MTGTNYPIGIDGNAQLPLVTNSVSQIVADDINRIRNATIAIETELGVNPSGTHGTVGDRLISIEYDIVNSVGNGNLSLTEMAAPATPNSGFGVLYEKTDGYLYFKNDSGNEYNLNSNTTEISTAAFLTLESSALLSNERVLAAGGGISLVDGGPNSSLSVGLSTSGVVAGAYTSADITVDGYGRVTTAANGSGAGAAPISATYLTLSTNGTLTNERVLTSGAGLNFTDNGANSSLIAELASSGVVAGTYTSSNITVDGYGRITTAANGADESSIFIQNGNSFSANAFLGTNDGYNLNFETSGVTRLTLSSSGGLVFNEDGYDADFRVEGDTNQNLIFVDASTDFVGIGTGTPTNRLNVVSTTAGQTTASFNGNAETDGANRATIGLNDTTALAAGVGGGISFAGVYTSGGALAGWAGIKSVKENGTSGNFAAGLAFMTRPNAGNNTEYMRITSAGNVGIGTSTPGSTIASKLDVVTSGDTKILSRTTGAEGVGFASFTLQSTGVTGNPYFEFQFMPSSTNNSNYVRYNFAGTTPISNILVVSAMGRVGVKTTTPGATLDINNLTAAESIFIARDNGTAKFTIADAGLITATAKNTSATNSSILVGDDLSLATASGRTRMLLGNLTANSELILGQDSTHGLLFNWTYNATAASAYGVLETYAGNNPLVLQSAGGKVGIRTTTPGATLDIDNLAVAESIFIARDNGTAVFTIADGGALTQEGGAVFNEAGGNFDFRVEGDTISSLLFVDASTERVGIGTNAPGSMLQVERSHDSNTTIAAVNSNASVLAQAQFALSTTGGSVEFSALSASWSTTAADVRQASRNVFLATAGDLYFATYATTQSMVFSITDALVSNTGQEVLRMANAEVTVNEQGANRDFRIEGDTRSNLFFVDASADLVGIGTIDPTLLLSIVASNTGNDGILISNTAAGAVTQAQLKFDNGLAGTVENTVNLYGSSWSVALDLRNSNDLGIIHSDPTDTSSNIVYHSSNAHVFGTNAATGGILASTERLRIGLTELVINDTSNNYDFRIESINDGYAVYVNGTDGYVGISNLDPKSSLDIDGSFGLSITTLTETTSLTADHHTVLVDATSGSITINLPTAVVSIRRRYEIKKINATNTVTVDAAGTELIDGSETVAITTQWSNLTIMSDGSAWYIV